MFEGNHNEQELGNSSVERHVSIGDAASILGVSIDTVRRWEKAGKLTAERLDGKNRYFAVNLLEEFNANRPLSSSEVAQLLDVSASTVRRLDSEGKLTAQRSEKGKRLYDRAAVLAFRDQTNLKTAPSTPSLGILSSVVETMTEAATEVDLTLKHEAETFKLMEQNEAGSLMNANLHLPFSGWKVGFYLATLVLGISIFVISNLNIYDKNPFDTLNRAASSDQQIGHSGSINLESAFFGEEATNVAVLPITSSQIKDGSIEDIDVAEGAITLGHFSGDVQELLGGLGESIARIGVGQQGPQGIQGEMGPQGLQGLQGPAGPAGGGSGISDVIAGLGLAGGGSTGSISLGVNTASGTTLTGDAVEVRLATSGSSSTTSSVSGMELTAEGLRLLGGCSAGNILKWSGSTWGCSTDGVSGTLGVANGGTGVTTFTPGGLLYGNGTSAVQTTTGGTTGQLILANATGIPTFTTLLGDATLNGTGVLSLVATGVAAATYGSSTQVPVLTVDNKGRLTNVNHTTITGVLPGGSAGGDLSGTYPNPSVVKINGNNLGVTIPTTGNILVANGSNWSSVTPSGDWILDGSGAATIQSNAVALGTDTTGNYVSTLGVLTGLTTTGNLGEGATPTLAVSYGSSLNTAVQGNTQLTVSAGTGLSGGGTYTLGMGGTHTLNLANTTVTAGTYGSANSIATFTVDAQGRLNAAGSTSVSINANQVTTGVLSVSQGGTGVDGSTATNGQLLIGNGSGFGLGTLAAGNGIGISNGPGSISLSSNVQMNKGLEVDSSGISLIDCAPNELLKYNGSNQWVCATDTAGGVTDGDKGDITVTSSGGNWSIDNSAVTNAKLQNSGVNLLYSGNLTGDSAVALGGTLNIGFSATPIFTSVNATTFTGNLVGNASSASALVDNPTDCAADAYATTIVSSGDLTCASITDAALSSNVTKLGATIDLATSEVYGNLRASSLQVAATDLGAADVNINLSNTNSSFNTNLTIDGVATASSFSGSLSGNASTATSLATDPTDCAPDTYAVAIISNGNLTCASITDAALSSNVTKLGATITKNELTNSGVLGFTWSDAEITDTLTVGAASTVADGALSTNVTKLGSTIDLASGEVSGNLLATSLQSAAADLGASDATINLSNSNGSFNTHLILDGSVTASNFNGSLTGNASTATTLATDPNDCASNTFAHGIDSSGNLACSAVNKTSFSNSGVLGFAWGDSEVSDALTLSASASVADGALSANVTKLGSSIDLVTEINGNLLATNLQVAAADLGAANVNINLSNSNGAFNTNLTLDGIVTAATFSGTLSGNATTATALAADPADCSASQFATTINASGALGCAALTDTDVPDTLTIGAASAVADAALSTSVTKLGTLIDLVTEITGNLRANSLQTSPTDLGAADVNINFGNTNGSFNTNLTLDGTITASLFSGSLSGNALTASALAADPSDCSANTYATTIAANGNFTCTSITDAALSNNVTKLGATITKDEFTGTGSLGFTWADSEVSNTLTASIFTGSGSITDAVDLSSAEINGVLADANVSDTLTIGSSSTVADGALSVNVTKLGSSIQNAEVDDDLTISASGSVADGALSVNVTKLGSAIDLATSEVSGQLRAGSLQTSATDLGAADVNINLGNTNSSFNTNLTIDGVITASSFSGGLSGNATTATALAADPTDCGSNTYATAIAANGNLSCAGITDAALSSSVTKLGATITRDELTGTGTLGFTWSDAEITDTLTVGAASTVADAALSGNVTKLGSSIQNAEVDDDLTISASGSVADGALSVNVTKLGSAIELATSEVSGQLRASNLQAAATDLGAANVDIVLSNSNGAFVTNLTTDGTITATSFSGSLSGNASSATALAANPGDCGSNAFATTIAANGDLTCSSVGKTALANSGSLAFTWADSEVSDTLTASILIASGSTTNAVDLATAEVAGNLRATNLQNAAADLGAADVNINLGNTNGSFNTNLSLDGAVTAAGNVNTTGGTLQLNGADINTAGTLTNVAYENQSNTFTVANTFSAAGTALSVTNNASIGGNLAVGSIRIGTSATADYVLTTDASGNATWQAQEIQKVFNGTTLTSGNNTIWTNSISCSSGSCSAILSTDGTTGGTAIFSSIYTVQCTAQGATSASTTWACGYESYTAGTKTLLLRLVSLGTTLANPANQNGNVYVTVIGN